MQAGQLALPGNELFAISAKANDSTSDQETLRLGVGLYLDQDENIVVSKPGILTQKGPQVFLVSSHQRRYIPNKGDNVIGIVTKRASETLRVDIGASEDATLSLLAFENATRRNKPDIKIGDLVFAKVITGHRFMDPELSCIDSHGKSQGLGAIGNGGFHIRVSLQLAKRLLSRDCSFLTQVGQTVRFEITIGVNGRVWVRGFNSHAAIELCRSIEEMEHTPDSDLETLATRTVDRICGF